jgi:hypothetical protein
MFKQVAVILAVSSLAATLVLPGRQTASVLGAGFSGLSKWTKVTQGRG